VAASFGVQPGQSILDRWKVDGKHKCSSLCPVPDAKSYPCKSEADGRPVAMFMGNLFRVDATFPHREGQGHDIFRQGKQALAMWTPGAPKYTTVACFMLTQFWFKRSALGPVSGEISCKTPTEVDIAFEKTFKM
jgi:hypothetical protein